MPSAVCLDVRETTRLTVSTLRLLLARIQTPFHWRDQVEDPLEYSADYFRDLAAATSESHLPLLGAYWSTRRFRDSYLVALIFSAIGQDKCWDHDQLRELLEKQLAWDLTNRLANLPNPSTDVPLFPYVEANPDRDPFDLGAVWGVRSFHSLLVTAIEAHRAGPDIHQRWLILQRGKLPSD